MTVEVPSGELSGSKISSQARRAGCECLRVGSPAQPVSTWGSAMPWSKRDSLGAGSRLSACSPAPSRRPAHIQQIDLETQGDVPGLDPDGFREQAEEAKTGSII